jgi:hypothetical protein
MKRSKKINWGLTLVCLLFIITLLKCYFLKRNKNFHEEIKKYDLVYIKYAPIDDTCYSSIQYYKNFGNDSLVLFNNYKKSKTRIVKIQSQLKDSLFILFKEALDNFYVDDETCFKGTKGYITLIFQNELCYVELRYPYFEEEINQNSINSRLIFFINSHFQNLFNPM